jgi:nucleotide-binding universal stress UspA family protein
MNKIVIAVNGSAASRQALRVAASILDPQGVALCADVEDIMSFYREPFADGYDSELADDSDSLRKNWQLEAHRLRKEILGDASEIHLSVQWHIVKLLPGQGSPAEALYRFALREKAEAIVVGQHKGARWVEGLLGSFPHWLVTHSTLPVMVVAPPAADAPENKKAAPPGKTPS